MDLPVGAHRRRLNARPTAIVFVGRAVSQVGLLAFAFLPSFRLTDRDFNALTVALIVGQLTCIAPATAFQTHLVRSPARRYPRDLVWVVAAGVVGATVSLAVIAALGSLRWWSVFVAAASAATLLPAVWSSLLALQGRFVRSAATDAIGGLALGATALVLVAVDVGPAAWAISYLATVLVAIVAGAILARVVERSPAEDGSARSWIGALRQSSALIAIGFLAMSFNRADYLILTVIGSDTEAVRYALAGRFVGPVLVVLGSLNNSLYVRQVSSSSREAVGELTMAVVRRVGAVAIAAVPVTVLVVAAIGMLSGSFADRELLVPTLLLSIAVVPFAFAIPFSYALVALGEERVWFWILLIGGIVDALLVVAFGRHGATATALVWVFVQCGVAGSLFAVTRRRGYW